MAAGGWTRRPAEIPSNFKLSVCYLMVGLGDLMGLCKPKWFFVLNITSVHETGIQVIVLYAKIFTSFTSADII